MTVLWITLFSVLLLGFCARYTAHANGSSISTFIYPNKFFVFIIFLVLALVSGLRNTIGDTYFYMHAYETNDFTWKYIFENKDPAFGILQMVLKSFSNDPQILILVTAIVTNFFIVFSLFKHTKMFELSLFVFITSGLYTVSMNGIRQFLAASIILWGLKYLLNGDLKKYLIIILIASAFHQSALILIPVYFIVRREAWTKVTVILLTGTILLVLGFNEFSELVFKTIQDTQYGGYENFAEGGANKIRVVIEAIPLILAFLGRDKLRRLWPKSDIIVNLALISVIFMIVATQNWIFARFNIYFSLYNIILISWLIPLFKENNKKFVYYMLVVCYLIYFYYEHVLSLGIIYRSNYINF
ncbi:EpsG family protein [Metabacillus sp. cB07]|uniref:EpsG family protein n=1 Tax=Metabacillus sp. cB07 TaxID=2806989 RepID=UPI001939E383|nr:EpsG family protein [Metabacillus sp. cB07]